MYLGSINPSASVVTIINAFGKAKLTQARLIIAGEGSEKAECIKAANMFQEAQIEFVSAPVETVADIQQQADVLLLPLKKGIAMTASPSKLTAYMFSGKPIIACVEEMSDTAVCIQEAKCGWVLKPENEKMLSNLMQDIIKTDRNVLLELGNNSRSYAEANMSRRVNLEKMTSIILQK
jgi:glycosyltransferase involved in cell wall biosynthesis